MERIKALLFDVDGVLCREKEPIPHAADAILYTRQLGLPLRVVSNNSLLAPSEMVDRLERANIRVEEGEVLLASGVLAQTLSRRTPRATVYLLGTEAVRRVFEHAGLRVIEQPAEIDYLCDYVVTAADPDLSYHKLCNALWSLEQGAIFACVEKDPVYPAQGHRVPGGGPTTAAVSNMLGGEPAILGGKPSPDMLLVAAEQCHVSPAECLVVGDSLHTDLIAARSAGMRCAIVLTGNASRREVDRSDIKPDWVIDNLSQLDSVLSGKI